MAKRFVQAGHEVHVITADCDDRFNGRNWVVTIHERINVHWIPIRYSNHMGFYKRVVAFSIFVWRSFWKMRTYKADVIFATSPPLTIGLPAVLASHVNKIPLVFEVRDLWPEMPIAVGKIKNPIIKSLTRWLERWIYNNSDYIVGLSPGICEGIRKTGVFSKKIHYVPNSCDFSLFELSDNVGDRVRRAHQWLGNRPMALYAGTLGEINDVSYLAHLSAALLKINPDVRVVVIGDGKEKEMILNLGKSLGVLNRNFFMLDEVAKKLIPEWFNAANIALSVFKDIPEMWNNSANKFFDALAAGRPLAINYAGWQKELIDGRDIGVILDPLSYDMAAESLCAKLADAEWLGRAGERARQLGREQFDRDKLAVKLESVLSEAKNGMGQKR